MNILLISDIHGNFPALEAVRSATRGQDIDHILNCGDTTVYAPFPNETIDWLIANKVFSIRGNTDDKVIKLLKGKNFKKPSKAEKRIMYTCTAKTLSPKNKNYLLELKKKKIIRLAKCTIGLFHGSPADHGEFLFADTINKRFKELAAATSCEIIITGHSHSPFSKRVGGVHFINPGSVGRMFDGEPTASYAILQLQKGENSVQHYRCQYDVEKVINKLRELNLPPIYQEMYRSGRKLN